MVQRHQQKQQEIALAMQNQKRTQKIRNENMQLRNKKLYEQNLQKMIIKTKNMNNNS